MKSIYKVSVFVCLACALFAQTSTPPKKKARPATITAADVQALRDAIAAQQSAIAQQQQQIQELRDTLQRRDQAVQQVQSTASAAATKADAAQAAASQQQQTVGQLSTDVTDLKANLLNTSMTLQETQKAVSEPPTSIHFKGITITPGGFLAAETVRRSRALASDINTPFNSVTMPGNSQSNMSEFYGTGRQSRISMLATGDLKNAKLSGYYEADFLSAGVTSTPTISNSYTLRQRQVFAQVALHSGTTVTGGQMWSLVTETKHGVDNRTEAVPMTIDPQYTVGFSWARQYGIRLSQNFGNKFWLAVSAENPQATVTTHGNGDNFLIGSAGNAGGLYNAGASTSATGVGSNLANYSFNPSPDVIVKAVYEPGFGHYEVFGVYTRFRDRIFPCSENFSACGLTAASALLAFNSSKNGGGVGANARWSFDNKHLDFGLHFLGGQGIGRYGTSTLPDASIHANGTFDLIRNAQALGTLEWHGPKVDVYFNAGTEYAGRAWDYDAIANKYVGYGSPFFSNAGCLTEAPPAVGSGFFPGGYSGTCNADTRTLIEGTVGFWFKPYDGAREKVNRGRIQFGPQFSYLDRSVWGGVGGAPHGIDGMIFTSFRYYLPTN
ncbi:MAG TPA: hypothetical protein VND65_06035 [Candidatus Binatia bacterium]|nr:hypothetical protein [Candidatus Binatia bacterium]